MMSTSKMECRKFSANIFNRSKCQNCFACKDSHSAEALDNNRVSRKVSKCGYLFVAPDWDFSNPINRTKRWQRRWFVLFDDGELTYSVDEHPDTIPQALIDMTKVIEVSNAEELTGNRFAIAIMAPEKVHFVKGTSREESRWWYDVLAVFPRSIKSRHKRNSTFPGGKASVVDRPDDDSNTVEAKNKKNSEENDTRGQTRDKRQTKRRNANPRSLSDGVSLMIPKKDQQIVTVQRLVDRKEMTNGGISNEKDDSLNIPGDLDGCVLDAKSSVCASSHPKNGDSHFISAVAPSIRAKVAAPRDDSTAAVDQLTLGDEKVDEEMSPLTDATPDTRSRSRLDVPLSPRSAASSDDEFKTASEASGRTEDYFEWADEDVDPSAASRTLPPSPPLNRTPISRVKERARTRSNVRRSDVGAADKCGEDGVKDDLSGSDRETYSTPRPQRRTFNGRKRKTSNGSKSDIPESMMVELLESEVDSLKLQLAKCQQEVADCQREMKNSFPVTWQPEVNSDNADTCRKMAEKHEVEVDESDSPKPKTCDDDDVDKLQKRLSNATNRLLRMKREVDEAEEACDRHEIECDNLRRKLVLVETENESRMSSMANRIEDLTSKLCVSEKQNRQIRQKLSRVENKETRRTRSLKGDRTVEFDKSVEFDEKVAKSVEFDKGIEKDENSVKFLVTTDRFDTKRVSNSVGFDIGVETAQNLNNLSKITAFYKEKETNLAQLGLLNKSARLRIAVDKMAHHLGLIRHVSSVFDKLDTSERLYWHARRLCLRMAAFEKKISDSDRSRNGDFDLSEMRIRVETATNVYREQRIDDLVDEMCRKAHEKCVENKNVDLLAQKLTELETKRVVTTITHLRESENAVLSTFWVPEDPETTEAVRNRLAETTDSLVEQLQNRFRQKIGSNDVIDRNSENSKNVFDSKLAEFVDVLARSAILTTRASKTDQSRPIVEMDGLIDTIFERESELETDVDKLVSSISNVSRSKTSESFADRSNRARSVQDLLKSVSEGKPSFFLNSVESRTARRSFRQRGQRSVTMPIFCSIDTEDKKNGCVECERFEKEIKTKDDECRTINAKLDENVEQIKFLERQLRSAEQKMTAKEREHKQQIAALKETYEQESTRDRSIDDEAVRQTYQSEIDQLRGLCEKGLVAMENSHRRIVAELEEKHERELQQLKIEKEQALAEETQATLAALDAMRKAHETELQREIAKFKQEFLEKMQSTHELDTLQKEQEEEIETIKEEILSLSGKYSIKFLENASLEERLKPLLQQLTDANSLAFDLTARNKQLRAMLNLNNADLRMEIDCWNGTEKIENYKLKLTESEVMEKNEEIADLKRMLRDSRRREDELTDRRGQLDRSLKAERRLRRDEVSSLRDRLEHIIMTSNATLEAAVASTNPQLDSIVAQPKVRRNVYGFKYRELMRSPSCPGFSNDSFAAVVECGGVVTSRKHFFEPGKSR